MQRIRQYFSTDFRKLVAIILVCFLLTNVHMLWGMVNMYEKFVGWHTTSMELQADIGGDLLSRLCLSDAPAYPNRPYCKKLGGAYNVK